MSIEKHYIKTVQDSASYLKTWGEAITPEILKKINQFSLQELSEDEIYVRRFLIAHDSIDRDNERFSEEVLRDFELTLPGKALLISHDRQELPLGLFYQSYLDAISPNLFLKLTFENANLPGSAETVKILWAWAFMLKTGNQEIIQKIEAGIVRYVSIGFRAAGLESVTSDGKKFKEYLSPAEATEGSFVYLGAQQGAMIKDFKPLPPQPKRNPLVPDNSLEMQRRKPNPLIPRDGMPGRETNPLIPKEEEEPKEQ